MLPLCHILLAILLMASAAISRADIVTLRDGTTHEGVVVKENGAEVVLEITIANIKTTKTFPRYKVRSIEYKPVDGAGKSHDEQEQSDEGTQEAGESSDQGDRRAGSRERRERRAARPEPVQAMQVTVKGVLGEDISSRTLEQALIKAKEAGVEHVVFLLDCQGGYLYDTLAMLRLLTAYDDAFSYYAMVTGDLPTPAYVFIAAADRVFVNPRVTLGGDVDYSVSDFGGDRVTDEPFKPDLPHRQSWSEAVSNAAQRTKKDPAFFETHAEEREHPVTLPSGDPVIDERTGRPAVRHAHRFWITPVAGQDLIDAGLAQPIPGAPSKLGAELGVEGWRVRRDLADRAVRAEAGAADKLAKRFGRAKKVLDENIIAFLGADPRSRMYESAIVRDEARRIIYDAPLMPSGESTRIWKNTCARAIAAFDLIVAAQNELQDVTTEAQQLGLAHAIMPDLRPGYIDELRKEYDWITEHRHTVPTKYLLPPGRHVIP